MTMENSPFRFFSFVLLMVGITSCSEDPYEIDPPSYITIEEFVVDNECFSNSDNRIPIVSEKISDVWVYINSNLQGAYELPVTFPITASGDLNINLRPGIKQNGISATRVIYPFYEFYTETNTFTAGEVLKIEPCVSYRETGQNLGEIRMPWKEDFEGVVDLNYAEASDTVVKTVSEDENVLEGNFAGGIFLDADDDFFELISPTFTTLPTDGTPIYLELNYRSNHEFFVGLYTQDRSNQINLYGFRKQEDWNKIYVDLSETVRFNGNASNFNVFIGFVKDPDIETVEFYIDNIKMLHF